MHRYCWSKSIKVIIYPILSFLVIGCGGSAFHESNGSFTYGKIIGKDYVNSYFNFKIRLDSIFTNTQSENLDQFDEWTYCIEANKVKTDSSLVPFIVCQESILEDNIRSTTPFIRFRKENSLLFIGSVYIPLLETPKKSINGFLENEMLVLKNLTSLDPSADSNYIKDKKFKRVICSNDIVQISVSCAQFGKNYLMALYTVSQDSISRQNINAFFERIEWTEVIK